MITRACCCITIAVLLAGCEQGGRQAEAETAVAKAVVTTEMPVGAVSDDQLQRAADTAVRIASTQPSVVAPGTPGAVTEDRQGAALQPEAQPAPAPEQ